MMIKINALWKIIYVCSGLLNTFLLIWVRGLQEQNEKHSFVWSDKITIFVQWELLSCIQKTTRNEVYVKLNPIIMTHPLFPKFGCWQKKILPSSKEITSICNLKLRSNKKQTKIQENASCMQWLSPSWLVNFSRIQYHISHQVWSKSFRLILFDS